jgi:hypothetical protein
MTRCAIGRSGTSTERRGLGLLLTIGSGCDVLASLVVLPVVLTLLTRRPAVPVGDGVRMISSG